MNVDPSGTFSWKKFWQGVGMVATAVTAIAVSVATFGLATPVAMGVVSSAELGKLKFLYMF